MYAHIIVAQVVAEKASEWGKFLNADLSGAFGSIHYLDLWRFLAKRTSPAAAHA